LSLLASVQGKAIKWLVENLSQEVRERIGCVYTVFGVIDFVASVTTENQEDEMNARLFFMVALIVAFALPLMVIGQEKKDSGTVTMTGCLNKGADADHYMIKDDKTGKETVVMGDAKLLAAHANNHQVTISGTMTKDKGNDVLKASDLKMISICK
jgi:hypothetical protein